MQFTSLSGKHSIVPGTMVAARWGTARCYDRQQSRMPVTRTAELGGGCVATVVSMLRVSDHPLDVGLTDVLLLLEDGTLGWSILGDLKAL